MTNETSEGRPCGKRAYRKSEKWHAARRALHADPEFKAKTAERMRALHADPEFNPLASLTAEQRENYDLLVKKGGYSRKEALEAISERPTKATVKKGDHLGMRIPMPVMNFASDDLEV